MKDLKEFNIPFVGLKLGKHLFEYKVNNTFFNFFEFDEFNGTDVTCELIFEKKTTLLELGFKASGSVNVDCDLTNEPFNLPIDGTFNLVVKFGNEYNDDNEDILIVPHGEYEINVAQYIYELIVLSVPPKRVHPGVEDGTLDSELLKKLEELSPKEGDSKENNEEIDPRWQSLKKLITDK